MKKVIYLGITMLSAMVLVGCSNTSSAPNTTSHSSNVKTEVKSSSTSKKEKKITAKAVDESSVVAESSSVDSNNNNSVSTNSNVQTATNQVASANSSVAKENSSVATGNNNVTENAVAPSVAAESSQKKVQEVNQQLTPAQIAALAAYYMGNDANSLTVHNMGNYNAVSGADGQLLFAYSADGNNLKVGGFGDTPWDSVNANDVMQKAQQQGNKDSINQVANNTTFEKGY